jgi:hypothetical protein
VLLLARTQDVGPEPRVQRLRNGDGAVGLLVLLDDGGRQAAGCQPTFRFHQIREGEQRNLPGLDGYKLGKLIIIDTSSSVDGNASVLGSRLPARPRPPENRGALTSLRRAERPRRGGRLPQ